MGIIKKIQRWLRDPRRSPKRRLVNQRSPVHLLTAQAVTGNHSGKHEQRSTGKPASEREEISRRMKEMVNRSTELRDTKRVRPQKDLGVYQERVSTRLARAQNPRSNARRGEE